MKHKSISLDEIFEVELAYFCMEYGKVLNINKEILYMFN